MVFFILQKQNTTRAPYCQRGIRNGQRPLWWSAQCHCHSFKLMFGLPHTHRHTQALKLKGLSLNHLLNETQKRRCAVKHPGEEPKRACEASSNRLELTSVIENVCFLQPGVEERCLRFFFIYIYLHVYQVFYCFFKKQKKRLSVKEPLVLRRAPKGPTVRGWKVTRPHPLFWSTRYDPQRLVRVQ